MNERSKPQMMKMREKAATKRVRMMQMMMTQHQTTMFRQSGKTVIGAMMPAGNLMLFGKKARN